MPAFPADLIGRTRDALWRRPRLALAAAVLLSLVALIPASSLGIYTRFEDLLPHGNAAADDYRAFLETFGGFEKVYVLVGLADATDEDLLGEAVWSLADALTESPAVSFATAGFDDTDERYLLDEVLPDAALLLAESDPEELARRLSREGIARRVSDLHARIGGPLGGFQSEWLAADPFGFGEALPGVDRTGEALPVDPVEGHFLSGSGTSGLVIVTPAAHDLDPAAGRELLAAIDAAREQVSRELERPLDVRAVGGAIYAAMDERIIRTDVIRTVAGSAIAVTLVLLLAFEGISIPLAILLGVGGGILWTGGLTGLLLGRISVVGISFGSILLGLGVDYGIHAGAVFRQRIVAGNDAFTSARGAAGDVGPGILASVATTAAAFLVLTAARLEPMRELGWIVTMGMFAVVAGTLWLSGSAAILFARGREAELARRRRLSIWDGLGRWVEGVAGFGQRHRIVVLAVALLVCLLSAYGVTHLEVETDLRSMRPEDHPLAELEQRMADEFPIGLDAIHVVVSGDDLDGVLASARRVATTLRADVPEGARVMSPSDWMLDARRRERARAVLRSHDVEAAAAVMREALDREGLDPTGFEPALRRLLDEPGGANGDAARPDGERPFWLAEMLREAPGGAGWSAAIRVELPVDVWSDGPPPERIASWLEAEPTVRVASVPRLASNLRRSTLAEGRRLGAWVLAVVFVVVLVSFRGRLGATLLAMTPVGLGTFWTLGLWGLARLPVDLFSLSLLPLLFGIGIDDGLHALHGRGAGGDVRAGVSRVGRGIALTSLTTCFGFGSLVLSRVPGLRHGGVLIALGIFICLLATLLVLPALERSLRREKDLAGHDR